MSISKKHINDKVLSKRIVDYYTLDKAKPTTRDVMKKFNVNYSSVIHILKRDLGERRYGMEKTLRYSRSRMGPLNPMFGKTGEQHHNWIGAVEDQKGYLTTVVDGERYFVHRVVLAAALGLHPSKLPPELSVHHIDENPKNNNLDNLAMLTSKAHRQLHRKHSKLSRLPLWVQWLSGTSK